MVLIGYVNNVGLNKIVDSLKQNRQADRTCDKRLTTFTFRSIAVDKNVVTIKFIDQMFSNKGYEKILPIHIANET